MKIKVNDVKALMVLLLTVVVLSLPASGALTVQSFSCNSQSGTITVDLGGTLNCEAVVKNTGNNQADLSSVSLITDGSWAEETTYTGIGFSSKVSGGGTTTASFGNIKPTQPGLHAFNYVKMDSLIDNFPSSSVVNVLSIKNLEIIAPENETEGHEFTVSATVYSGGNQGLSLLLALTDCTLKSGQTTTQDLGSVSDNTLNSVSWRILAGLTNCNYLITATATSSSVSVSEDKSGMILVITTTTTTTTTSTTTTTTTTTTTVPGATTTSSTSTTTLAPVTTTSSTTLPQPTASDNRTLNVSVNETQEINSSDTNMSVEFTANGSISNANLTIARYDANPQGESSFSVPSLGKYFRIQATSNLESAAEYFFLRFYYTASEVNTSGLNESDLAVWWFDSNVGQWVKLNATTMDWVYSTGLNTSSDFLWSNTSHLSDYAIASASGTQQIQVSLVLGWNLISLPVTL